MSPSTTSSCDTWSGANVGGMWTCNIRYTYRIRSAVSARALQRIARSPVPVDDSSECDDGTTAERFSRDR
jgi:hypothetical protein